MSFLNFVTTYITARVSHYHKNLTYFIVHVNKNVDEYIYKIANNIILLRILGFKSVVLCFIKKLQKCR